MNVSIQKQARLIYDSLDNKNPKQALSLCQKSMKKYPESHLFKALNGLALSSMYKPGQASLVMDELVRELGKLEDVATLTAMGHTLRRLDRDAESADCFEKAFVMTSSEEVGIEYFFSALKGLLFRRCHQAALKLYKLFSKERYYLWATMSLYNASQTSDKEQGDTLSLSIVEKMVKKALEEKKLKTFQDYTLCQLLSDKEPENVQVLLDVPSEVFPSPLDGLKWRVNILKHLGKWSDLLKDIKGVASVSNLLEDWDLQVLYFEACLEEKVERTEIQYWSVEGIEKTHHKRAHYLGKLELALLCKDSSLDAPIEEYFRQFGDKESCFSDLLKYLPNYSNLEYFSCNKAQEPCKLSTEEKTRILSGLKIQKYLEQEKGSGVSGLKADDYYRLYKEMMTCTEFKGSDLIILGVSCLLEEFQSTSDNSCLYKAADWLLEASESDELNFYVKLVLLFVLRELGGVRLAIKVYASLNIKNVQMDSLSYILYDWMPMIGFTDVVEGACAEIASLYESNTVETPRMLIEAYRYGSYSQIPEFVDFYIRLRDSIQKSITSVSRIQSEILRLESKPALIQYFRSLSLPALQKTLIDNRPLESLFSYWSSYGSLARLLGKTGSKDTAWIETCYAILYAMKSAFGFGVAPSEQQDHIDRFLHDISAENTSTENTDVKNTATENTENTENTSTDTEEDPLLKGLFKLVYSAYKQDSIMFSSQLESLCTLLTASLKELSTTTPATPDAKIIKIESIVEIVHYSTIFTVGLEHLKNTQRQDAKSFESKSIPNSTPKSIIQGVHSKSIPKSTPNSIIHGVQSKSIHLLTSFIDSCLDSSNRSFQFSHPQASIPSRLADSLNADAALITAQARKSLQSSRKILKSIK